MKRTFRSNPLERVRASTRTVAPDRAILAAEAAIRTLGIDPERAKSAVREQDACLARTIYAGVLYRLSLVSLRQVGRFTNCGKATAQARLVRFEGLEDKEAIVSAARAALAKIPK
jgi:hypothetical protein